MTKHDACTSLRRLRLTHGKFNILTGRSYKTREETITRTCNAPLFTGEERASGLCRACASGWQADGNRPATAEEAAAYHATRKERKPDDLRAQPTAKIDLHRLRPGDIFRGETDRGARG